MVIDDGIYTIIHANNKYYILVPFITSCDCICCGNATAHVDYLILNNIGDIDNTYVASHHIRVILKRHILLKLI
jgi:hypothetical protein